MAHFRIPRFGKSKLDLANRGYHVIQALEAHIHVYTYFVYGESGLLGGGGNGMARATPACARAFALHALRTMS